jgi:hypothetical protein
VAPDIVNTSHSSQYLAIIQNINADSKVILVVAIFFPAGGDFAVDRVTEVRTQESRNTPEVRTKVRLTHRTGERQGCHITECEAQTGTKLIAVFSTIRVNGYHEVQ